MSGFIGFVGIAGLVGSIIIAVMDPSSAVAAITTGISSCIVCFLIVHVLGIMYDIRDTLHDIKDNTKKIEPKTTSTYTPTQSHVSVTARAKTGWTCKSCGQLNATTASFCKGCGKDR